MAEHYYTNDPTVASKEHELVYASPAGELRLTVDRGVFSGSGVDFGTDLLIRTAAELEEEAPEALLDLGCGYGPIGLTFGRLWPGVRVVMADVNERALALARRNALALGVAAEAVNNETDPPQGPFGLVLTNPPIRAGKQTVYALFAQACGALAPGGRLYVVIQKKQGADSAVKELGRLFGNCRTVEREAGYHILCCEKVTE